MNSNKVTYFDSFGVENIPKEIMIKKNIKTNICRVICGCFCIRFFYFMLNSNRLTDFTNLFSAKIFFKNYEIVLEYFQ